MPDDPSWRAVDLLFGELLIGDDLFEEVVAHSLREGLPPIHVSAPQGRFLHILVRAIGARRVLEIGTLGGYSSGWIASALPDDGRLYTLEFSERHARVARENLDRLGIGGLVEITVGPALDSLGAMISRDDAPFEFIFIDANKEQYPEYFERALELSQSGTLIVADNVVRSGEVVNQPSSSPETEGVLSMLALMGSSSRVVATAIQTVGEKGYDGFALGYVI
ncbi:MAG: O-methyltransferase [Acidimicrobiales bacterium]